MLKYSEVIPEVIVGLGEKTEYLEKEQPFKTVSKLHIHLEDWLGDDLMECFPCFIVTEELKEALKKSDFTGFQFDELEVTKDEYFQDNYQLKKVLPKFYWMKITGVNNVDDFYINNRLFVSDNLFTWLKSNFQTNYLSDDNRKVDDFMKRFMYSQRNFK